MTCAALLLMLALHRQSVDAPRLEYYHELFTVHTAAGDWSAPLTDYVRPAPRPTAFRRDNDFAVWDERGLTVRRGDRTRTFRFEDFPVSGRFFGRDDIQRTVDLVARGQRSKAADALSGAVRIGSVAYFLLRWDSADGKPWTEALVRVNLRGEDIWPKVLGRYAGASLAYKPVDDRLFVLDGRIACVVRQPDRWGLATYDATADRFEFRPLGATLLSFMATLRRTATFVERTSYGTTVAGRVDLGSTFRRTLVEARGSARFLDPASPPIVLATSPELMRIIDGETGSELRLEPGHGVARAGPYIVVWSPAREPQIATLYAPERWTPVARWRLAP